MASWRDTASQQAQDDLDGLLDFALPFARQQLDRHGEFFPYGASVSDAGEVRMVAADPGLGEQPPSLDVLAALVDALRLDREGLRAAALVADVRLGDGDAVRVQLEHRDGHAITVFLPYRKKRFGRGIEYLELSGSPGDAQIWTA